MPKRPFFLALAALALLALGTAEAAPQKKPRPPRSRIVVAKAQASPGATVRLSIQLVDRTGTPLGAERPWGERIQGIALRIRCVPCTGVAALAVGPAGELARHAPTFEVRPTAPDGASLLVAYDEAAALLFAGARSGPTRWQIATVVVTLDRAAPLGSRIELRLDPATTALSNQAGTVGETTKNGWLELVDGEIVVGRTGKSRG